MHFVSQVLMVGMSWGAGIKTKEEEERDDPNIIPIHKAYGRLRDKLQAHRPNDFATLKKVEDGLRELNVSLVDIPLIQTGTEVADHAHTLLGLLDAMHKEAKNDTWRSRIGGYVVTR